MHAGWPTDARTEVPWPSSSQLHMAHTLGEPLWLCASFARGALAPHMMIECCSAAWLQGVHRVHADAYRPFVAAVRVSSSADCTCKLGVGGDGLQLHGWNPCPCPYPQKFPLGVPQVDQVELAQRWSHSTAWQGLQATLGSP